MNRPRLFRLSYLVWIVVPLLLFGIYRAWGLPHVIWSYSFQGGATGFGSRHYITCSFAGPYGGFTVPATNGRCGWVLFRKQTSRGTGR
ncbi:MAG: hypothetical protein WDZ83_20520 [Rhizobiaceae bacterium]